LSLAVAAASLALLAPLTSLPARAESPAAPASSATTSDLTQPQVENAKHTLIGRINSSGVSVRSGPNENFYPTMKLEKGAEVTVVGIKYDWLKIEPPAGSFSYVGQVYVDRFGDGKVGRTRNAAPVRAGSDLVPTKSTLQTRLPENTDVTIQSVHEEYYKIAPPAGTYLYVHQKFVDLVKAKEPGKAAIADAAEPKKAATAAPEAAPADAPMKPLEAADAGGPEAPAPGTGPVRTTTPTTAEVTAAGAGGETVATQPAAESAGAKFDKLEAEFAATSGTPVTEQPIAELLARYQDLAKAAELPESMRRVAGARIAALKVRGEAKDELAAVQKSREQMRQRTTALRAEQDELAEQMKANEVTVYTAVGTLRTSSLQHGRQTLYRLTDPETGRTLVYVRSSDPKIPNLLNQFVGVNGSMQTDPQLRLRVITTTDAKAVDQTQVNGAIAAQVIPPSLLPRVPVANTPTGGALEGQ
jgi:hypothetical protein